MSNPDIYKYTKELLRRYNATPDEWENFYSICDLDEIKIYNSYVNHAAKILNCLPEHIELNLLHTPACAVDGSTPDMRTVTLLVCINVEKMNAVRFSAPGKFKYYDNAREAMIYQSYTSAKYIYPIIDMLCKDLWAVLQEYEISEEDGNKIDAHLKMALRFLQGKHIHKKGD